MNLILKNKSNSVELHLLHLTHLYIINIIKNQAKAVRKYFNLSRFQLLMGRLASLFIKLDHLKFRNNIIEVYRAPEPGDVIWENLGYDAWSQLKR